MGYFNYFIKCIIRKFVNLFFKPKGLLIIFIIIFLLYLFCGTARAEWTDDQITNLQDELEDIRVALIEQLNDLEKININTDSMRQSLVSIDTAIYDIIGRLQTTNDSLSEINTQLSTLLTDINNLNQSINNVYNELDENQKELLAELEADNQAVLEELKYIREAIVGTENKQVVVTDLGTSPINIGNQIYSGIHRYYIPMEIGYTYEISITYNNTLSSAMPTQYFFYEKNVTSTQELVSSYFRYLGSVEANSVKKFTITYTDELNPYLYVSYGSFVDSVTVSASIPGITGSLDTNNQLQQQQNQLQQEQNDFLKDDNVNSEGLEFATDDTVNPTTDGFNTLFNTIYNAFCNTSSEPLTITLPYINKTFTIQPNIVSNGMQKAGLGVIVTLINSFYYFSVCLFIYKDIGKIVDNLKSGNITSDCGNVKTEVL